MAEEVNLYDGHYGDHATDPQVEVRRETYGEDLGQASWITADEARRWFDLLGLGPGRRALEVACGSGGVTCAMARHTGAECVGVDINVHGINAARSRAERHDLSSRVTFEVMDAGKALPLPDESLEAVFCNDSINHLADRAAVVDDWRRLLRPGGRVLFTDPVVVTGQLSSDEIRTRSSIGFFLFTPLGQNERLLSQAGFRVLRVEDVTGAVESVSGKWRDARAKRREQLAALEGTDLFEGLQRFLISAHTLARERRLSRYMYLAEKPPERSGAP